MGDPAVRHRGTIGGSIANNDPNADYPAGVLGLGATIITNKRRIHADEFFKGMFETALEPDEIITKVQFPKVNKAAYVKFPNPASRYALVGVFVEAQFGDPRGGHRRRCRRRVPRADVRGGAEEALRAKSLEGLTIPADGMAGDIHGSAEYRAHLVGVLARRAVARVKARRSGRGIAFVADAANDAYLRHARACPGISQTSPPMTGYKLRHDP